MISKEDVLNLLQEQVALDEATRSIEEALEMTLQAVREEYSRYNLSLNLRNR